MLKALGTEAEAVFYSQPPTIQHSDRVGVYALVLMFHGSWPIDKLCVWCCVFGAFYLGAEAEGVVLRVAEGKGDGPAISLSFVSLRQAARKAVRQGERKERNYGSEVHVNVHSRHTCLFSWTVSSAIC